jgi:hypothetical protein
MVIKGIDFVNNSKVVSGTPECSYHMQKVEEQFDYLYVIILIVLVVGLFLLDSLEGEL